MLKKIRIQTTDETYFYLTNRFGFARASDVLLSPSTAVPSPVCSTFSEIPFWVADSFVTDGCCSSTPLLTPVASSLGSKSGLFASCSSIHSSSARWNKKTPNEKKDCYDQLNWLLISTCSSRNSSKTSL